MNESPAFIANELCNPAWKDHCLPAAVDLMRQAAVALGTLEKCFQNEKATSLDLERLHQMAVADYEREKNEVERLRKALNRIAMHPWSSEAARGIAAVALQVPCGENAVANPAAPGAACQNSADSRTASGVTGRRDGHSADTLPYGGASSKSGDSTHAPRTCEPSYSQNAGLGTRPLPPPHTEPLNQALLRFRANVRDARESVDDPHLRDALFLSDGLIGVLAHVVNGMEVLRAFGAPGDWGYGTPIGDGLLRALDQR